MSKQNSAPTMKDVAREAGVALGMVSKAINGIPVGERCRVKVEKAIEKLNCAFRIEERIGRTFPEQIPVYRDA